MPKLPKPPKLNGIPKTARDLPPKSKAFQPQRPDPNAPKSQDNTDHKHPIPKSSDEWKNSNEYKLYSARREKIHAMLATQRAARLNATNAADYNDHTEHTLENYKSRFSEWYRPNKGYIFSVWLVLFVMACLSSTARGDAKKIRQKKVERYIEQRRNEKGAQKTEDMDFSID